MAQAQHQADADAPQQQTPPAQPAPASASSTTTGTAPDIHSTPTPAAIPSSQAGPYLPLPAPSDIPTTPDQTHQRTTQVEVNGQAISLDHLGPTVIGRDGSLSRIANWGDLTDRERTNTLRILGKRNQLRLASLRSGDGNTNNSTTPSAAQ